MPADGCRESSESYLVKCPNEECGDDANFLLNRTYGSGHCLNERLPSGYRRYSSFKVAELVGIEGLGQVAGSLLALHEAWGEVVSVNADILEIVAAVVLSEQVSKARRPIFILTRSSIDRCGKGQGAGDRLGLI